jgi:hypothetical protein
MKRSKRSALTALLLVMASVCASSLLAPHVIALESYYFDAGPILAIAGAAVLAALTAGLATPAVVAAAALYAA